MLASRYSLAEALPSKPLYENDAAAPTFRVVRSVSRDSTLRICQSVDAADCSKGLAGDRTAGACTPPVRDRKPTPRVASTGDCPGAKIRGCFPRSRIRSNPFTDLA